ncbi:hypothetical protein Btru_061928 [Bulinus truncatus]|nr:hypothetical protein Btru_061928 [Bulinus truncatus]
MVSQLVVFTATTEPGQLIVFTATTEPGQLIVFTAITEPGQSVDRLHSHHRACQLIVFTAITEPGQLIVFTANTEPGQLIVFTANTYHGHSVDRLHSHHIPWSVSELSIPLHNGQSLDTTLTVCSRRSGYCPPGPVLMDTLTGYETLTLFGRLRGLRRNDLHSQLGYYVHLLQLGDVIHKRISLLSLSSKKRLNVAIALIGNPALLILNDPTELLDNTTTNIVWGMLRYLSRGSRFILIATKHARGCQHICTQLSVMHGVHLVAQSDIQNLADKYFHGYTASLKFHFTSEERNDVLRLCFSRLVDIFPDVEIFSEDTSAHFYFSSDTIDMSKLFAFLEDAKLYYCLWDYTVQQTKLEQIVYYLDIRCAEQIIEILPEF